MSYSPNAVVAETFSFPDFRFTMNISGAVTANDVGKAVSLDATAANTVKLAGDGDVVYGRLETVEQGGLDGLVVGAIARKFRARVPIKSGLTGASIPAIGDTVVGAGAGQVKAAAESTAKAPNPALNTIVALVGTTHAIVEML